jgi:hypothetical protein
VLNTELIQKQLNQINKTMKTIIKWVSGLFKDEKNSPSSKRFVGILCGLTLCITLYVNSYTHGDIKPADSLVNSVALLAFGCLGLSSVDKFTAAKKEDNVNPPTDPTQLN